MLKERWLRDQNSVSVVNFKDRLMRARKIAMENLREIQGKMKEWYDKKPEWGGFLLVIKC